MNNKKRLLIVYTIILAVLLAVVWAVEILTWIRIADVSVIPFIFRSAAVSGALMILYLISLIIMKRCDQEITTVRERVERSDKEQENNRKSFRAILDNIHQSAAVISGDGVIEYLNKPLKKELDRLAQSSALKYFFQLMPAQDGRFFREQMKQLISGRIPKVMEEIHFQSNRDQSYQLTAIKLPAPDNENPTALVLLKNETGPSLPHSEKKQFDNMTKSMAHDFNNQLMAILGSVALLEEKTQDREILDYIGKIRETAERSIYITEKLVSFTKDQSKTHRKIRVKKLIDKTLATINKGLPKDVVIDVSTDGDDAEISGSTSLIQNSLTNLCMNALEALDGSGRISISYQQASVQDIPELKAGEYLILRISNDGPAISKADMNRIFDPFFTTKKGQGHSGLGLAAAIGAVRSHKGTIRVESSDKETTFSVYLPVKTKDKDDVHFDEQMREKTGSILLVDDEDIVRSVTEKMIRNLGFEVKSAGSGQDALKMMKEEPQRYEGILLDMIMPEMDGIATFRKMRKINPDLKVMLLSGYNMEDELSSLKAEGIMDIILKPVNKKQLSQKIHELISR